MADDFPISLVLSKQSRILAKSRVSQLAYDIYVKHNLEIIVLATIKLKEFQLYTEKKKIDSSSSTYLKSSPFSPINMHKGIT